MSKVMVLQPGFYTSIQDFGRTEYAHYGVPRSGVMDTFSAQKANLLLNNSKDSAVLEITMTGPQLQFETETQIAICGAQFDVYLNDTLLSNAKAYTVKKDAVLRFGALKKGFRAYLAVQGGFQTELILGSRGQYAGITEAARLKKGDALEVENLKIPSNPKARVNFENEELWSSEIPVFKGPEYDLLTQELQQKLFENQFTLSPSGNRMAIPFKELLPNELSGILTGPVLPGTVQLTPNGNLIALMQDCQVTGGYPRILQISQEGLCRLAQKRPGEPVQFKLANT